MNLPVAQNTISWNFTAPFLASLLAAGVAWGVASQEIRQLRADFVRLTIELDRERVSGQQIRGELSEVSRALVRAETRLELLQQTLTRIDRRIYNGEATP
jgi:hypothetical protein